MNDSAKLGFLHFGYLSRGFIFNFFEADRKQSFGFFSVSGRTKTNFPTFKNFPRLFNFCFPLNSSIYAVYVFLLKICHKLLEFYASARSACAGMELGFHKFSFSSYIFFAISKTCYFNGLKERNLFKIQKNKHNETIPTSNQMNQPALVK